MTSSCSANCSSFIPDVNRRIFSQQSMMSSIRCSGLRDKDGLLFDLHLHLGPQALRGEEVHGSLRTGLPGRKLKAHEVVKGGLALERYEDIHVTLLPVVAPGHRPEDGQ